ncbi:hypothetical protein [Peribacillus kribbensis]|uniref:hypothetical protein n=1 Tax=Peribacillus kribbensis TaxID=356658 RepID=UPI0004073B36|nr:hypothetical protein [Peribacillus kribbensis]
MFERNIQRLVVGSAIAIATTALLPVVKKTLSPIVQDFTKQMRYLMVTAKEGIEDMAAEVKFERMRKAIDKELAIEGELLSDHQPGPFIKIEK